MGGPGSGRHWRWDARDIVEQTKAVDVTWLRRRGMLGPGQPVWVSWIRDGEPSGNIAGWSDGRTVLLWFTFDGERIEQRVHVEWTPWRFSGERPWFRCPSPGCERRALKLYWRGRHFICRICADLRYRSQNEDWGYRALTKAQAIRARLGGSESLYEPFPVRPKGMHRRTYRKLLRRAVAAENRVHAYGAKLASRAPSRPGRTLEVHQ